jgi:hypothetical protein
MYSKQSQIRDKAKELLDKDNYFTGSAIAAALSTSRQYVHQAVTKEMEQELGVEKKKGLGWIRVGYTGPLPTVQDLSVATQRKNKKKRWEEMLDKVCSKLEGCDLLPIEDVRELFPALSKHMCRRLMADAVARGAAIQPAPSMRNPDGPGRLMNVIYPKARAAELVGGRAPDSTTILGRVREALLELKKTGDAFYVSGLAEEIGVNNGLVLNEVRRLVKSGELEFVGQIPSKRRAPRPRNMFQFKSTAPKEEVHDTQHETNEDWITDEVLDLQTDV